MSHLVFSTVDILARVSELQAVSLAPDSNNAPQPFRRSNIRHINLYLAIVMLVLT